MGDLTHDDILAPELLAEAKERAAKPLSAQAVDGRMLYLHIDVARRTFGDKLLSRIVTNWDELDGD